VRGVEPERVRAQLEHVAVRQAPPVGAVHVLLHARHHPPDEEGEQRGAVVGLLGRAQDHAEAAFSASRWARPAAMTSLNDRKRKMRTTAPRPVRNVSAAIAICWPTE
jgi:hypothetical protein